MAKQDDGLIGPVSARQRIQELDVLRGIALFGVLVMNFVAFAADMMTTGAQQAALPTATADWWTYNGVRMFVGDKANTVFATLFGLGFYLQMKRGEGRPGFEARYRRRLFWLLIFGWLNTLFLWVWDILNLYAVAGFFLLAMRRWHTKTLLLFGIPAALYSDKLQTWLIDLFAIPVPSAAPLFEEPAILARQALAREGDYPALVESMWQFTVADWLVGGLLVALLLYALGRFALGAAIGRSGILDDIPRFIPLLRRVAIIAIPLGLALALLLRLVVEGLLVLPGNVDGWKTFANMLRSPTALVLAAGYCAGIVVALQRDWGKRLFGPFAAVGQMALTNYLAQGLIYGFILFGVGPGLGLAGSIGSFYVLLICIAFFAFQVAFSHWWLARFRFGPMEWVWRALTYGERPALRRSSAGAAAPA